MQSLTNARLEKIERSKNSRFVVDFTAPRMTGTAKIQPDQNGGFYVAAQMTINGIESFCHSAHFRPTLNPHSQNAYDWSSRPSVYRGTEYSTGVVTAAARSKFLNFWRQDEIFEAIVNNSDFRKLAIDETVARRRENIRKLEQKIAELQAELAIENAELESILE